jgi:hypothetical protein
MNLKESKEEYMGGFRGRKGRKKYNYIIISKKKKEQIKSQGSSLTSRNPVCGRLFFETGFLCVALAVLELTL